MGCTGVHSYKWLMLVLLLVFLGSQITPRSHPLYIDLKIVLHEVYLHIIPSMLVPLQ